MARLSEVAMRIDVGCLNPHSGEVWVNLSKGMARPGERISPKRDNVMICCFKLAQAR